MQKETDEDYDFNLRMCPHNFKSKRYVIANWMQQPQNRFYCVKSNFPAYRLKIINLKSSSISHISTFCVDSQFDWTDLCFHFEIQRFLSKNGISNECDRQKKKTRFQCFPIVKDSFTLKSQISKIIVGVGFPTFDSECRALNALISESWFQRLYFMLWVLWVYTKRTSICLKIHFYHFPWASFFSPFSIVTDDVQVYYEALCVIVQEHSNWW